MEFKKLAEGIDFCFNKEIGFKIEDEIYEKKFQEFFFEINLNKLGSFFSDNKDENTKDFINETFSILKKYGTDLTIFFRSLSDINNIISK
jgi:uncharacterized protein YdiU (UPF0061 family)